MASPGSRRTDDESVTAATSPHASASTPPHRILRASGPCISSPGEEEGLFIRDLRHHDVDVSLYRGTRYELLYSKSLAEPLLCNQTTYVIQSGSITGPHVNKCAGPVILHPSRYRSITCFGSPQSLLSFLHDSKDFLGEIRFLRLSFNVTQQARTFRGMAALRGPFHAMTAQAPWAKLFNVLVRLNLETFVLVSFDSFWKSMPWEQGANHILSASAASTETAVDAYDSHEDPSERNFLRQVTRLSGVTITIAIEGHNDVPKRRKFVQELQALIAAEVPKERLTLKLPRCTCPPGSGLEGTCFWKLVE